MTELEWAETYRLVKQLPTTAKTLSLRTRVTRVTDQLAVASATLESLRNSLRPRDLYPLQGGRPGRQKVVIAAVDVRTSYRRGG
jgi:hypothetical protein